ncbi:MAG TPA: phytanoyl-CoA dioxygenase family protein [Polyangiaceae bacterium]|nr:phytanoyl-CoA dioxygenase family protein [Polyangiaceae bacterium]
MLVEGAAERAIDEALAFYATEGYAPLGRVLTDEALATLRERSDDLMLGRVAYPGLFFQRDPNTGDYDDLPYGKGYEGPSLDYRKLEKLELDPLFFAYLSNPLFGRIARRLVEGAVAVYRATLFNKPAAGGTPLPWHQDDGRFWGIDRAPALQIWTALDDATVEAGCVEVVPGSHREGLATPLGGLVPANLVAARGDPRGVLLEARAGDAFLLHNHAWHRSGVNRSGRPRRAFTVCYLDAQTRCLRRRRAPRQFVRAFE